MREVLAFDDVLIVPKFSSIKSRKDVDLSSKIDNIGLRLPIISSNMDTVTESTMANAMALAGGVGCLHRFMSIEDNVKMFKESYPSTWCSVGLGEEELERALALNNAGCRTIVVDVAHGASEETVKQYKLLYEALSNDCSIIVGNFATREEIKEFIKRTNLVPNAFKVGIGGGSACSTRVKTGCGLPTLASLLDCYGLGVNLIADGGVRTPGDVAKALAIPNVCAIMLGGMLAGTAETPGEIIIGLGELYPHPDRDTWTSINGDLKIYRGSASKESYNLQGKSEDWRTAEGESFMVPYKGPVKSVLQEIEGGLRSAFSYVGASNLKEFKEKAEFVRITHAGALESTPHGKKE